MKTKSIILLAVLLLTGAAYVSAGTDNVAEEVAWVVGDQPIWKSEIEEAYQTMLYEKMPIAGDPYCVIPEQLAIEKLYLHQAELDTVTAPDSWVMNQVEAYLNNYITNFGSKEKVEQYFHKSIPAMRESLREMISNRSRVQQVQQNLTSKIKATPADVRRYFEKLPEDSVPWVPLQVEVQIFSVAPAVSREAVEDVKARLRSFSDQVNKGESQFSTLAILYSEDGSAGRGGELGFMGRGELVPEFAAVAFNLNDPKKVSKIVETEYGFHIIQLIEKRGDRINTRHILLRPKVSQKDKDEAMARLDSVRTDIVDKKMLTFEEAVKLVSQDKDTRMSNGVMVNGETGTTRFEMSQLPQEVAIAVSSLQPGEISKPFIMRNPKSDREVIAIVRLTSRLDAHQANLADDYQTIKDMYENARSQEIVDEWLEKKIKDTYVRIEDGWRGCDFRHKGWIKN